MNQNKEDKVTISLSIDRRTYDHLEALKETAGMSNLEDLILKALWEFNLYYFDNKWTRSYFENGTIKSIGKEV